MNANKLTIRMALLTAILLGWCVLPAIAQDDEGVAPAPAEDILKKKEAPAGDELGGMDDLEKLLKLTPGELDELIKRAKIDQLRVEREQAAAEIRTHIAYKDDQKGRQKAIDLLTNGDAKTAAENIELMAKAFAAVDRELRVAQELLGNGKFAEAAAVAEKHRDVKEKTYRSALTHYLYAQALTSSGRVFRGVEAYRDLMAEMPDRLCFAAMAGQKAAEAFEKLGRMYYAMEMYAYCLENYGLTLEKGTIDKMAKRYEEIRQIYQDPMASVASRMGDVVGRLNRIDSGEKTQEKQQEIVALLEDLIKTIEEKAQAQQKGKGKGQERGRKQGQGKGSKGKGKGKQGKGKSGGPPSGTQQPSSPAMVSAVVPGAVERPKNLSTIREGTGTDGWARLSPREKEQLEELRKRVMSERNREQNADYATSLTRPDE